MKHLIILFGVIFLLSSSLSMVSCTEVTTKDGDTPIHVAVKSGDMEEVKLLIENGADINAKNIDGETPLHYAVEAGETEIAKLLIAKGADINAKLN